EARVCRDLTCHLRGAAGLQECLERLAAGHAEEVHLDSCSCLGLCDQAPALLWNDHPVSAAQLPGNPFSGFQPDGGATSAPHTASIDPYGPAGCYAMLRAVLQGELSAEQVIEQLKASGLRGMGGAGFPAGTKWELVRGAAGAPKYL